MSNLESSVNEGLVDIENKLINLLNLVDYKGLCEEQLGYTLDQNTIREFITKYNNFLGGLHEVEYEEDNALTNGTLIIFMSFMLAFFSLIFTQTYIVFFSIIILGFILYCILKAKNKRNCKKTETKLSTDWKEYRSILPYNEKVISIMEDIVYDYCGEFEYPSDFYKELYLRLKNNMEDY